MSTAVAFQLLAGRGSSTASASGNGAYFDHIVFIAMENAAYASVFGSGTVSSCPSSTDPFLCSMLPLGSTVPSLNNYGATAADANDFSGCSAACYVGLLAGYTYSVKDGYGDLTAANLVADRFAPAGLTWQAYCESGCPRGNDHFPFTSFADTRASANVFASSSVSTSTFSAAANSTNPPNFLWYTPTDNHNMHDNSISTGDSYLKSFLVGSGSLTNPASGSLLASNLFTNTNYRTLLYLWWDECGGSNGSCNNINAAPNLLYGTPVKKGYVSPDTTGIDEYASLRTIANNWGFSPIAQGDVAAANSGYMFNDVFSSSNPVTLSTSFTLSPTSPVLGTTVAFTATAVGGTLPYSYSWSFGDGSTGSGMVTSHSYSSAGQYSVTVTVTDSTGKTATSSQSLAVLPGSTGSGFVPTLIGWGGVKMDESVAGSGGTFSAVFPGEYTSDVEMLLILLKAKGYNTVRVDFDPYCSDTVDYNYMSVYSQTNAQRAIQIAQHYGFWIIIDYHGYSDVFRDTTCWLSYWKPIVQNLGPSYSQIIWEPENEPEYYNCTNSPSSCPSPPCSTDTSCVTYLSSAYQQWIDQARSLGDTHWIVVQNMCSYSCNLCPGGDGSCSAAISSYPSVTDPLGTLSQGGKIFISLHSYMDYRYYSNSTGWSNSTADSVAQGYYQTVVAGVASTGWPALNTEGGTDPLCYPCSSSPPDTILSGSAGYTTTTLHFIQMLVNMYDSNSPQRINWVWWPAGDWTNTTSSIYGAMNCASNPEGWGCLLNTIPVTTGPPVLSTNFVFTPKTPFLGQTITFTASAIDGTVPYTFNWSFGDGSTGTGSSLTHAYSSAGTYSVILTVKDSSSTKQTATSRQTISVDSPPPALTTGVNYGPSAPETNQQVTFTASASGGISPYSFGWSFGDGGSSVTNPATHTYSASGSFTVTVTVTDANGAKVSSGQSISVALAPSITFTTSPTSPEATSSVTFSASVTGGVGQFVFIWTFGDGGTSTSNPATHTYTSSGSFAVTVTTTDANGGEAASSRTINVAAPLGVSFNDSQSSPLVNQSVTFTATASGGVGTPSFSWSFGDGSISAANPATHTYTGSGAFKVTVTATDSDGSNATSSQTITVATALTASFTYSPSSLQSGQPVSFSASTSGGTPPYSYSWSFGDGSTGTDSSTSHTYSSAGSFTITLTVKDSSSPQQTVTSQKTVTINSPPPQLSVSFNYSPSSPQTGQQVTFSGSASGGTLPYSYSWSFGDGSTGTGSSVTHTYPLGGTYTVVLTVTDGGSPQQTASSQQSVTITSPPPPLGANFTFSPSSPAVGQQVTFTATSTGGTAPYSYGWSFGDGSTGVGSSVTRAYSSAGRFTVVLTVNDSGVPSQTISSQQIVIVSPLQLTVSFTYTPSLPQAGQQVTFTAQASGGTGPYSFNWTFGDSSNATGSTAVYRYSSAGNFSVTLTIQDSGSPQQTATSSMTVDVSPIPLLQTLTAVSCPGMGVVGVGLTCTVTVVDTASGSVSTPTGFVSLTPSNGCTLSGGSCSISMTPTVSGILAVSASYGGDAEHLASTSPMVFVTINNRETLTSVTCTPSTPTIGQSTSCSATVTDTSPGTTSTPTGNVTFTPSGVCVLTGTGDSASCSTSVGTAAVGSLSVSATYLGDSTHNASSGITTVNVVPPPSPPLAADFASSPTSPIMGQTVNFTATATGGSSPYSYSWTFGDGSTGSGNTVSHAYESANTYSVVLVVTDANGTTVSDTKVLVVSVTPNPPIVLTVPSSESVYDGANLAFNVSAVEDSSLQISLSCESCSALGANFTFNSGSGTAYGTFSWTPSEAQAPGVYQVVLSSTDGTQIVNATVTITVNEDYTPPSISLPGSTLTVRDGETLQFTVLATDSDAPPENITLTATGLPDGSSFDSSTGVFSWPIQGVQPGVYTLTFTATDNGTPPLQDSQTIVIHVDNGNGRCFICDMSFESQLILSMSPSMLLLRAMVALIGFLSVITVKHLRGLVRQNVSRKVQHSADVA